MNGRQTEKTKQTLCVFRTRSHPSKNKEGKEKEKVCSFVHLFICSFVHLFICCSTQFSVRAKKNCLAQDAKKKEKNER
jgi:hypothetical protein